MLVAIKRFEVVNSNATLSELTRRFLRLPQYLYNLLVESIILVQIPS